MRKAKLIYELIMFVLVILSLVFAFSSNDKFYIYDKVIWIIFVIDYSYHLMSSKKKWEYVKGNPLELVAIIPFDSIFRVARLVRVFRVVRLLGIGSRFLKPVYELLKTNGLDKLLVVAISLVFIVSIPINLIEPTVESFPDALWWAIVTVTTVGYGDISPETGIGRILAVLLMLIGIGIIGTFTSAITSYFSQNGKLSHDKKILSIIKSIEDLEEIKSDDIELIEFYMKIKRNKGNIDM